MATQEHIAFARSLRQRDVSAEDILWQELRGRRCGGYKFVRQHPIDGYTVDFCCRAHRVVIEIDGPSHDERREYHLQRTEALEAAGYVVFRMLNDDVFADIDACCEAIFRFVEDSQDRSYQISPTPSSALRAPSPSREKEEGIFTL